MHPGSLQLFEALNLSLFHHLAFELEIMLGLSDDLTLVEMSPAGEQTRRPDKANRERNSTRQLNRHCDKAAISQAMNEHCWSICKLPAR